MYICPVCGYNELPEAPEDWMICPCCNTTFGYSDENWGVEALRKAWIDVGAVWGSEDVAPPPYWSPVQQLRNIDYEATDADKISIARARAMEDSLVALIELGIDQTHVVAQLPFGILVDRRNIIIAWKTSKTEVADTQNRKWQPQPA